MAKHADVEIISVTPQMADLARRRTKPLMLAAIHWPNALEQMLLSAYVQGLEDGADAVLRRTPTEPR